MTTIKKCDWVKKNKKRFKSLIWYLSANKIDNYNRGGRNWKKKKRKIWKNLQNKSKNKHNKCFSWVTALRVLSLAGSHSPPYLPSMPSNTMLISGPAVGAAQILIWSYSWVFLPPMSTPIRASAFSFVGALNGLLYIPQTQSLLSWSCGFNLQLVQLVGRFWIIFLSHTAPGFQLWFYFHLYMCVVHWGLPPKAVLEGLGLPLWEPGVEVVQLFGSQGFWQHQVLRRVCG